MGTGRAGRSNGVHSVDTDALTPSAEGPSNIRRPSAMWALGGVMAVSAILMGASVALAAIQSKPDAGGGVVVTAPYSKSSVTGAQQIPGANVTATAMPPAPGATSSTDHAQTAGGSTVGIGEDSQPAVTIPAAPPVYEPTPSGFEPVANQTIQAAGVGEPLPQQPAPAETVVVPEPSATISPPPTTTPEPTATDTPVPTVTPTQTAIPTGTATPTETASPTSTPTETASPTETAVPTQTSSRTVRPTEKGTPAPTGSATATATSTSTATVTRTSKPTCTPRPTATRTVTHTKTPTATATWTRSTWPTRPPTVRATATATRYSPHATPSRTAPTWSPRPTR